MLDQSGTNFCADGLDTRFQQTDPKARQSGYSNVGGELNLAAEGLNTLIAEDLKHYHDLADRLEQLGIAKFDSSHGDASKKIPVSKGIQYALLPLWTVKCGLNPFEWEEKSPKIQDMCGEAIVQGVLIDAKFRAGLGKAIKAYNVGSKLEEPLRNDIIALRTTFAVGLGMLKFQRQQATIAINDMEPALAASKLTTAGHQVAQLLVSPADAALGGKR